MFLNNRCQRVALNGQSSDWKSVTAGVPQGSVLGPLFFIIYISDLPLAFTTNVKLFADGASFFSVVNNASVSASRLNNDLVKNEIGHLIGKCRLTLILLNKRKRLFFQKTIIPGTDPSLFFNNSLIEQNTTRNHFGLTLDQKLTFQYHVNKNKQKKTRKGIGLLRKLQSILRRISLLTIYKSFMRPHLDYGNVIYDQPSNNTFPNKLETVQYNATLAITGAIKDTSREKLYQELGL